MVGPKKHILIRVDSSSQLGYGHVYRCVTLGEYLRAHGAEVQFATRLLPGHITHFIEEKGFIVHLLDYATNTWEIDAQLTKALLEKAPKKFDWLIVDHYLLDYRWEEIFFNLGIKVLVIDDLVDKKHHCHYLLNQTVNIQADVYRQWLNSQANLLLGEKYILLRPEFVQAKEKVKTLDTFSQATLHVFFGGSDVNNYCYQFSELLLQNFPTLKLKVVTGSAPKNNWELLTKKYNDQIYVYSQVKNMAENMLDCALALGAPGMATWERASLGLVGIYLATNANQIKILEQLADEQFCYFLGQAESIKKEEFLKQFSEIIHNENALFKIREMGLKKIDAKGGVRVSQLIMSH